MLSQYALRVLAEIHTTGIYVWVRGSVAFLDDPQRTAVRYDTVDRLLRAGHLAEDPGEFALSATDAGRSLLDRNKEAVGRAHAIDGAQQFMVQVTGKTLRRPNGKSTVRV